MTHSFLSVFVGALLDIGLGFYFNRRAATDRQRRRVFMEAYRYLVPCSKRFATTAELLADRIVSFNPICVERISRFAPNPMEFIIIFDHLYPFTPGMCFGNILPKFYLLKSIGVFGVFIFMCRDTMAFTHDNISNGSGFPIFQGGFTAHKTAGSNNLFRQNLSKKGFACQEQPYASYLYPNYESPLQWLVCLDEFQVRGTNNNGVHFQRKIPWSFLEDHKVFLGWDIKEPGTG